MSIEHWGNPRSPSGQIIEKTTAEHAAAEAYTQHTARNIDLRGTQTALPPSALRFDSGGEHFTGESSTWVNGNPPAIHNSRNYEQGAAVLGNLRRLMRPEVSPDSIARHDGNYGFIHPETGKTVGYLGQILTSPQMYTGSPADAVFSYAKTSDHPIYSQAQRFFGRGEKSPIAKDESGRAYVTVMHHNGDGRTVPLRFWCSTGTGRKENTPVGQWYYTPGMTDDHAWMAKFSERDGNDHVSHYGSPILKFYSDQLGKLIGNVSAASDISKGNEGLPMMSFNPIAAAFIPPVLGMQFPSSARRTVDSPLHQPHQSYSDIIEPLANTFTDPDVSNHVSSFSHPFHDQKSTGLMGLITDFKASSDRGDWPRSRHFYGLLARHFEYLRRNLSFGTAKSLQKSWFNHAIWPDGR